MDRVNIVDIYSRRGRDGGHGSHGVQCEQRHCGYAGHCKSD